MGEMKQAPLSMLSTDRIVKISELLQSVNHLEGNIAEVGCYKGGIGYYLSKYSIGKSVYLFDTFEGIPMKSKYDRHKIGDFDKVSYEEVKDYFKDDINVRVIKGVFPISAKEHISDTDKFCFVHLDADQYESTKDALEFFYPKMVKGGIIVFDDWLWLKGVIVAIREFFETKQEKPIDTVKYQCYIIKL